MKDHIFITVCGDTYAYCLYKFLKSFNKFNPGEEIIVYDDAKLQPYKDQGYNFGHFYPVLTEDLLKEYKTVIHIDVDTIITDNILNILDGDYDIAAPLNNNSWHHCTTFDIDEPHYLNAGLHAIKSPKYAKLWHKINKSYGAPLQFVEQDTMNQTAYWGDFNIRVLDDDKEIWGCWILDKWNQMVIKDNKLYHNDRVVKMLHWAGGNTFNKLNYHDSIMNQEVKDWLDKIFI